MIIPFTMPRVGVLGQRNHFHAGRGGQSGRLFACGHKLCGPFGVLSLLIEVD